MCHTLGAVATGTLAAGAVAVLGHNMRVLDNCKEVFRCTFNHHFNIDNAAGGKACALSFEASNKTAYFGMCEMSSSPFMETAVVATAVVLSLTALYLLSNACNCKDEKPKQK